MKANKHPTEEVWEASPEANGVRPLAYPIAVGRPLPQSPNKAWEASPEADGMWEASPEADGVRQLAYPIGLWRGLLHPRVRSQCREKLDV